MADKMVVNVYPYEGEYDFDMNGQLMSPLEWEWVTNISGYLPAGDNSFIKGLEGLDPKLFVAFAVVAMVRAGKVAESDVMDAADALKRPAFDGSSISYRSESEEVDADPPSSPEPDDSKPDSGPSSSESSDASQESSAPPTSGIQDWATGSISDRPTPVA